MQLLICADVYYDHRNVPEITSIESYRSKEDVLRRLVAIASEITGDETEDITDTLAKTGKYTFSERGGSAFLCPSYMKVTNWGEPCQTVYMVEEYDQDLIPAEWFKAPISV